MDIIATARQIVCSIVAAALSLTVAAADALLSSRPDLMERVDHLAVQLRAAAGDTDVPARHGAEPRGDEAAEPGGLDESGEQTAFGNDQLLLAYNQLWQFVHDLRSEGVSMDDDFCERIEREWSVTTLLTYVRNVDRSLQENAGKALQSAATHLRPDS